MNSKVLSHFKKVDPTLYKVVISLNTLMELPNRRGDDYFVDLVDAICSQQLSGKAAATIFGRFKKLFKNGEITPSAVLKMKDEKMRAAGMSYQKIKYIKDLAAKVESEEIDLKALDKFEDDVVVEQLVQVKGIGKWTAEMFLI